ncbi:MAG: alpha/beta hydrolase [Bdellovibrionota bacterium]
MPAEFSLTALMTIAITLIAIGSLICILYLRGFLYNKSEGPGLSSGKHNYKSIFGHKVYFTQEGEGDHILLLHGIGASHFVWRFITPKLAETHAVTAVDLLGFGLSDKPNTFKYDLDSQCDMILELLKNLGIKKTTVIGSSMGGTIALRLAQINPELFNKVVVLSPAADPKITFFDLNRISFLSPVVRPLVTERFVKQIMKRVYTDKKNITDENIRIYSEPYLSSEGAVDSFVKSFSLLRDPRVFEQLDGIKNPVLIIWGQKDRIIPFKFAQKIQKKIPHSLLEIHQTAGHHVQEDDPDWVLSKIFPFLKA